MKLAVVLWLVETETEVGVVLTHQFNELIFCRGVTTQFGGKLYELPNSVVPAFEDRMETTPVTMLLPPYVRMWEAAVLNVSPWLSTIKPGNFATPLA